MPIYEYRCQDCASTFEVLTRFAERDRGQACPRCESLKTRVLVSSFAVSGVADAGASLEFGAGSGGCCGGGCGSCGSPN
ncbi:MAG TPA: zinc ribbon domain-containing protein [Candidatus Acidoferrales bacterium]|nr:zinc ribbon domain-containing protein [Candidatus Acidoferrales bacterium]